MSERVLLSKSWEQCQTGDTWLPLVLDLHPSMWLQLNLKLVVQDVFQSNVRGHYPHSVYWL